MMHIMSESHARSFWSPSLLMSVTGRLAQYSLLITPRVIETSGSGSGQSNGKIQLIMKIH